MPAEILTPSTAMDGGAFSSSATDSAPSSIVDAEPHNTPTVVGQYGITRSPFIFTRLGRKLSEAEGGYVPSMGEHWRVITASLNPTDYSFNVKLRGLLEKVGGGEVKHVFEASEDRKEELGDWIDEPTVQYNLQFGHCAPMFFDENGEPQVPPGIDMFFAMMELLLQDPPMLSNGASNNIIIVQNTVAFPLLVIEGKVDPQGISWTESEAQPTTITGVTFTVSVSRTVPRITSHLDMRVAWRQAQANSTAPSASGSGLIA